MRRTIQFVIMGVITIVMVSCQSKEEKAAEFIKNELSKTLYDFESYQPIETTVTEAKMNMFNDSACWKKAAALAYGMKKATEYLEETKDAKEHMDIWGRPSYYSYWNDKKSEWRTYVQTKSYSSRSMSSVSNENVASLISNLKQAKQMIAEKTAK